MVIVRPLFKLERNNNNNNNAEWLAEQENRNHNRIDLIANHRRTQPLHN